MKSCSLYILLNYWFVKTRTSAKNILKTRFIEIDNKTIFIIEVKASLKPVFITNKDNQKEFYIRTTQGIIYLDIENAINYCLGRFK